MSLTYSPASRPSPAIEAIAYFCTAELLNNAAKHSGGTRITMKVATAGIGKQLVLSVLDDGIGGSGPGNRKRHRGTQSPCHER
ncbi:hypothetical protein DQ353_09000 [Arthrobacter sp. AQ5-05]|uniref:hypothetical protein n=1 Tax=Arthrobacter sp. AQ5-05 TaxID=2184581 RepID=UPI000DCDBD5E|nr:hypothetical protein [Arthrobacter sp. AQ5-05]RAX49650.1 hypothetical protein DQ353_09000 [Arthrobacter sp. AQ5-05]